MNPVTGLALGRVVIGAGSIAQPELAMKLFRLSPADNDQLPYMARMFGSREIALGALTLASSGATRRNLILAGIAVDAADAAAGHLAGKEGYVSKSTSAFLTAPALAAVAAGLVGLAFSRKK